MEPSSNTPTTDQRLTDLEIKASFTEDLLDKLDSVIVRQQQQIDALIREIADLKQQAPVDGGVTTARSLRDDLPPHFLENSSPSFEGRATSCLGLESCGV